MGSKSFLVGVACVLTIGALGAAGVADVPTTTRSCSSVLEWKVCTWIVMDGDAVVELGATIPMALIEGVPADAEMVWPPQQLAAIGLPEEARVALGIDHMGVNWEAHGHPPMSFMAQHFDFHFYSLTPDEVQTIDCSDESKPSQLPSGYALPDIDVPGMGVLVGLCVPGMGMHAMLQEEVTEKETFAASMMLGYYGGDPLFFEPMVSRELLLSRSDFALPVPSVEHLPAGVIYPTEFRAEYDAATEQYHLVFSGFDSK